jgi:hypothetical protein
MVLVPWSGGRAAVVASFSEHATPCAKTWRNMMCCSSFQSVLSMLKKW